MGIQLSIFALDPAWQEMRDQHRTSWTHWGRLARFVRSARRSSLRILVEASGRAGAASFTDTNTKGTYGHSLDIKSGLSQPKRRQLTPQCQAWRTFAPSSSFSFPEAWVRRCEWQPSRRSRRDRERLRNGRPKTYPSLVP